MKESVLAIYNTLGKLQMPPTPDNTKHMAAIYIKLEEIFAKVAEAEAKEEQKNAENHDE